MKKSHKKRIFNIIQIGQKSDFLSRFFDIFISIAIVTNITVLFLSTFDELSSIGGILDILEILTLSIFIIEYALRLYTSDLLYPDSTRVGALLKFIFSFDGIVDFLTILPFFYLTGFAALRLLRVVRIFRLFRLNSYYDSFNVITTVLKDKKNQILSSLFIIVVMILFSSLGIYSVEHDVQPDVYKNAFSGIWWCVNTIFTVGFGDIYPITILGQILSIIIVVLGAGIIAIPTGIISAGFVENYQSMQKAEARVKAKKIPTLLMDDPCPYSGSNIYSVEKSLNIQIVAIIRNSNVIIPSGRVILEKDDIVIYHPLAN